MDKPEYIVYATIALLLLTAVLGFVFDRSIVTIFPTLLVMLFVGLGIYYAVRGSRSG